MYFSYQNSQAIIRIGNNQNHLTEPIINRSFQQILCCKQTLDHQRIVNIAKKTDVSVLAIKVCTRPKVVVVALKSKFMWTIKKTRRRGWNRKWNRIWICVLYLQYPALLLILQYVQQNVNYPLRIEQHCIVPTARHLISSYFLILCTFRINKFNFLISISLA